jgi:AcrR family transcriptional regulator
LLPPKRSRFHLAVLQSALVEKWPHISLERLFRTYMLVRDGSTGIMISMRSANQAPKITRAPDASKARIVDAAQIAFGKIGYARSSVRDIAEAAGVAPSLVMYFFGSKERLFEEALARSVQITAALSVPRDAFGENAIDMLSRQRTDAVNAATMLAQSIADPAARAVAGKLLRQMVLEPIADWLSVPHADGRARLIVMLTLGFTTFRLLVPPDETDAEEERYIIGWMEQTLQQLTDSIGPDK